MKKFQITNSKPQTNSKSQIPMTKTKVWNLVLEIWCLFGIWCLVFGIYPASAQDSDKLVTLSKKIIETKADEDLYAPFEELKDLYFSRPMIKSEGGIPLPAGKDNKYEQFVEFLKSLSTKKKGLEPFTDYYIALTRYSQLKYLEETQSWDEYFAKGNTYRDEITTFAQKAVDETSLSSPLHFYSRLILWQFHKDQEDTFSEQALLNLMQSALEYSKEALDIAPIKKAADTLSAYGEKAKSRELYKVYMDRLVTANTKAEELNYIALGFYKEGNLDLAENLYDIYIDRIKGELTSKERLVSDLINIARQFSYKDQGQKDPFYAEKIFKKIEEIGGKDSFDEELMSLRGFNLEKIKDYPRAQEIYTDLIKLYPEGIHAQEVNFKIGIIQTYVLRDIEKGKVYFEGLAQKETASPRVLSSLYQLGLINQWQGDFVKAKDYYNRLIEKLAHSTSSLDSARDDPERVKLVEGPLSANPELAEGSGSASLQIRALADERLKEIEGQKPIEYNLRMFLDVSLKEENPLFNPAQVDLKSSTYKVASGQILNISAVAYAGESGCMQPQLTYLWSGDLGDAKPTTGETQFSTKYLHAGTKVINLVATSSAGIIDRTLDMVDVD